MQLLLAKHWCPLCKAASLHLTLPAACSWEDSTLDGPLQVKVLLLGRPLCVTPFAFMLC